MLTNFQNSFTGRLGPDSISMAVDRCGTLG